MDVANIREASRLLLENWSNGRTLERLPRALMPDSADDAYAVQALVEDHSSKPLLGWKIAATSAAGQAHIGVPGPIAGRLIAERLIADPEHYHIGRNSMRSAEPEFALRIGRDLPPREEEYSLDELSNAVDAVIPSIEVPDCRFTDVTAAGRLQLIADNSCAHDFALGTPVTDWRRFDLSEIRIEGGTADQPRTGGGANVLGGPLLALQWLVEELGRIGETLQAGQIVMTGAAFPPVPIDHGTRFEADFGPLGRIALQCS